MLEEESHGRSCQRNELFPCIRSVGCIESKAPIAIVAPAGPPDGAGRHARSQLLPAGCLDAAAGAGNSSRVGSPASGLGHTLSSHSASDRRRAGCQHGSGSDRRHRRQTQLVGCVYAPHTAAADEERAANKEAPHAPDTNQKAADQEPTAPYSTADNATNDAPLADS